MTNTFLNKSLVSGDMRNYLSKLAVATMALLAPVSCGEPEVLVYVDRCPNVVDESTCKPAIVVNSDQCRSYGVEDGVEYSFCDPSVSNVNGRYVGSLRVERDGFKPEILYGVNNGDCFRLNDGSLLIASRLGERNNESGIELRICDIPPN